MLTLRSLLRCLAVGACTPLVFAACGDNGPDAEPIGDGVSNDSGAGQTSLTASGTTGSTSAATSSSTSAGAVTGTPSTTTAGTLSTTGVSGSGGLFPVTTSGGGPMGSTGIVDMGGAGGVTGSSSSSSGGQGAGGSGGVGTTSGGGSECEFEGNIRYQFNQSGGWPSDVVAKLTTAMDGAMYYYNCYADLDKALTIGYDPGVPTAQGNVDGWITFGSDPSYMVVATAMHEVAHTLGVAYSPWTELIEDDVWTGPAVAEFIMNLPAEQRDPDETSQDITCDSQHFWPYGLNYPTEHKSEWSLINNVRIVAAMQRDKQAYLAGEL